MALTAKVLFGAVLTVLTVGPLPLSFCN